MSFIWISSNLYAQTGKGYFLVSGSSDFSFISVTTSVEGNDTENKTTYLNFTPVAGYFVADNLSLGLLITYMASYYEHSNFKSFVAGPFFRYYFAQSKKLVPFVQTSAFFGSNEIKYENIGVSDSKISSDLSGYELDLGLGILLSKQVSFDVILGYAHTTENIPVSTTESKKIKTGALGVSLGLSLYLGK